MAMKEFKMVKTIISKDTKSYFHGLFQIDDSFFAQRGLREKILGRLREDLDQRKAEYEKGVAYAFPTVEEHCGHRVREVRS